MPYSKRKNAVYIWIPKTAGTSMVNAFKKRKIFTRNGREDLWGRIPDEERETYQAANWQHLAARDVCDIIGEEAWRSSFKFTIVRNTYDRLVSFYEYSKASRSDPNSVQYGLPPVGSFEEWFEEEQPLSQLHYLVDANSNMMMDFIGYFENLPRDVFRICLKLKTWPIRLPKRNTSVRREYHSYYNADMRKRVENVYGDEIERFKYRF